MVTYQFQVDDEIWTEWKRTVPRDKSLETRIIELIEADADGRVLDPGQEVQQAGPGVDADAVSGPPPQERIASEGISTDESGGYGEGSSGESEAESLDDIEDALGAVEFPQGRDRPECVEAIGAAYNYLQREGSASMREIVTDVMPGHSLGYDVPDLEPGERYRGSWWRKVVKPGLKALPDVRAPTGGGDWRVD